VRVGCGCLILLLLASLSVGVAAWLLGGVFQAPEISPVLFSTADGISAQQKLFGLTGRSSARAQRSIVLSERELNAFIGRHLTGVADIPITGIVVRLQGRRLEVAGRVPARVIVAETPVARILNIVPARWADHPIWVRLRGGLRAEPARGGQRRYLRLDVDRFYLGRSRLPAFTHRLLLSPLTLRLLTWPVPGSVDDATVEDGHVVIRVGAT
jgi:hypothetical protein